MTSERITTTREPKFFKDKELFFLKSLSPQGFVASLNAEYLLVHIAGAAWDSFYGLDDKPRSEEFLKILKSDVWINNKLINGPIKPEKQVATAIAFLMENDSIPYEQHQDFIAFCSEYEIFVSKKQTEKIAKKIRKNKPLKP